MKNIDYRDIIVWLIIIGLLTAFFMCLSGCAPLRNTETTIRDSTVVREFDIKIPEKTVNHQIDLDSLCKELDAIKAELKKHKSNNYTIYRSDTSGRAQLLAQIDSIGGLYLQAVASAVDTTGKETVRSRSVDTRTVETQRQLFGMHPAWIVVILVLVLALIFAISRILR